MQCAVGLVPVQLRMDKSGREEPKHRDITINVCSTSSSRIITGTSYILVIQEGPGNKSVPPIYGGQEIRAFPSLPSSLALFFFFANFPDLDNKCENINRRTLSKQNKSVFHIIQSINPVSK